MAWSLHARLQVILYTWFSVWLKLNYAHILPRFLFFYCIHHWRLIWKMEFSTLNQYKMSLSCLIKVGISYSHRERHLLLNKHCHWIYQSTFRSLSLNMLKCDRKQSLRRTQGTHRACSRASLKLRCGSGGKLRIYSRLHSFFSVFPYLP